MVFAQTHGRDQDPATGDVLATAPITRARSAPRDGRMIMQFPKTTERVARTTASASNERIAERMRESVWRLAGRPDEIDGHLDALDREWDIERALEMNAASIALVGLGLGATVDRRFFVLPAIVAGFLLQHAIQGWCPPVPLMRRLGFRTQSEIEQERYAVKALRGDFATIQTGGGRTDPAAALRAAQA
jgi:hypothetical protein